MATMTYKCPGCSADIKFDAKNQNFHCDYCNNSYTKEEMKELEVKIKEKKVKTTTNLEGQVVYHCSQCGANIMADENTVATFCLYCQNPSIVRTHVENALEPDLIIPFKINRDDAIKAYKTWCSRKLLVPNDFKTIKQQEKMSGLYVPYWLYDIKSNFDYDVKGIKTATWKMGNYRYTKVDTYKIERIGYINYTKIPADSSSKMDDEKMSYIEPFDYKEMQNFGSAYLSGFYADKYDEDNDKVFDKIMSKITDNAKKVVNATITGYGNKSYLKQELSLDREGTYYTFFPVWILTYKYNDKIYQFTMNGQTGKIVGDLPISKKRSIVVFIIAMIFIFLIYYVMMMVSL